MDVQSVVAITCNPIHVCEFSWTIENISRIPLKVNGPSFSPIPNRLEKFRFQLLCNVSETEISVRVYLIIGVEDYTFNFLCDVKLCNADDAILNTAKCQSGTVKEEFNSEVTNASWNKTPEELEFVYLPKDKMVLKAKFSISGYDIIPVICSSTITHSRVSHGELSKDLKTMFKCGYAHDVAFSVRGEKIRAHKAVLRSRSPRFAKMFESDIPEKRTVKVIEFTDVSDFSALLLFLYTGEIENTYWESVVSLYHVADEYEVASLRNECSRILADSLTIASVCRILDVADYLKDAELKETAKIFLRKHFSRVVVTSEWSEMVVNDPQLASEVLGSIKSLPELK